MTPELVQADRAAAVRAAARSWRRAGIIDDAALAAVQSRFPDDRVRVGPVFRALLFLFTVLAVSGGVGFVALTFGAGHDGAVAVLALAAGAVLVALTELQIAKLRRRQGGIEAATSLMAIIFLVGAAAWYVFTAAALGRSVGLSVLCLIAAPLLGAAALRWGYPLYAGAATAAALVTLAGLPAGRAVWIALPLAAAPALLRLSESPRLPPAHRSSAMAALVVALAGLYLAVHVGFWDSQVIEAMGGHYAAPPHGDLRWWSAVAATALVPILLLGFGLWRRRLPLLLAGAGTAIASLATLRGYVDLGPTWLVLTLAGALWIAAALALWRYLDSGPAGERGGFTAAPLLTDSGRLGLLEAGVAALTLRPAAGPAGGEQPYAGGGGRSGGAGASGEF